MLSKTDLEQIGKVVDERIEPLKQGQAQTNTAISQIKTVLKVLEAGQNDIRENMATKADLQDIKADLVKQKRRIENLEESTKTPNPHKN